MTINFDELTRRFVIALFSGLDFQMVLIYWLLIIIISEYLSQLIIYVYKHLILQIFILKFLFIFGKLNPISWKSQGTSA